MIWINIKPPLDNNQEAVFLRLNCIFLSVISKQSEI